MVDDRPKTQTRIADRGVLEHRMIAIAIAKANDGPTANRLVDPDWLSSLVVDKHLIEGLDQGRYTVSEFQLGSGR